MVTFREVEYKQRVILEIQELDCPFCLRKMKDEAPTCDCGATFGEIEKPSIGIRAVAYRDFSLDQFVLAETIMEDVNAK